MWNPAEGSLVLLKDYELLIIIAMANLLSRGIWCITQWFLEAIDNDDDLQTPRRPNAHS